MQHKIATQSVDLCYIDPPFNSKRNYFQIYNNIGTDGCDKAQAQAFVDTWEWGDEAQKALRCILAPENSNNGRFTEQTVALITGLEKVLGQGGLLAYLVHMTLRIVEIHRVLKSTGSFYLHCDPTASHYLKLICDSVFCAGDNGGEFLNEIIWCYATPSGASKKFPRKHDVIFYYSKSKEWFFEIQRVPHKSGLHNTGQSWHSRDGNNKHVRRLEKLGKKVEDWWIDIYPVDRIRQEMLGYPTQKPEALLERIMKASSKEGDVVLDAYCGCGTTIAVAQRLNRRWIGIDITYQSISLVLKRLRDRHIDQWSWIEANIQLDGIPCDMQGTMALANRRDDKTRKEFEKWAVLTYSDNQARIHEKKGADKGVDGTSLFIIDGQSNGKAIYQVKSGTVGRQTIAALNHDRRREGAQLAILITLKKPTKSMLDEARCAGKFKHLMLGREYDSIQIVSVQAILSGDRINLPLSRTDHTKSAQALGDTEQQSNLF